MNSPQIWRMVGSNCLLWNRRESCTRFHRLRLSSSSFSTFSRQSPCPGAAEHIRQGRKFPPTFESGTEKRLFPSYFWWLLMAPKCTKLHRFAPISNIFKNFPGLTPRIPKTGEGISPSSEFSIQRAPTVPLFQCFRGRCPCPMNCHALWMCIPHVCV